MFIEVTERNLRAHQQGLTAAIAAAGEDVAQALNAVAEWLLNHPPMDLMRMAMSDLREVAPSEAIRLGKLVQESLLVPVRDLLLAAQARGEIGPVDCGVIAGGMVTMMEGLHAVPDVAFQYGTPAWIGKTRLDMAHYLIGAFMKGLLPRDV